jgi:hypothetical protein
MIYGGSVPSIAPLFTGFVNGDTFASLSVQPGCGAAVTSLTPVGTYPTSCSGAADPNYTIAYAPGSLVIGPAPTSISVASSTRGTSNYGQLVTFTPTVSGTPVPPGTDPVTYSYTNSTINGGAPVPLGSAPLSQVYSTFTLPPGTNTITATFDGDHSDANFASSSASVTQVVTPAPVAFISPGSVNFPNPDVGSTSASATVILTNIGTAPLSLAGVQVVSGKPGPLDFIIQSSTCGSVLPPGPPSQAAWGGAAPDAHSRKLTTVGADNSCSVTLAFAPKAEQRGTVRTGTLVFFNNNGGQAGASQYIALTGSVSSSNHGKSPAQRTDPASAVSAISLSPSPLTFLPVNAGQSSTPMTVTITNNNEKLPINFSGISLTGANSTDFAVTGTTCTNGNGAASVSANSVGPLTLAPAGSSGNSCNLTIVFRPGELGTRTSSLVFAYAPPAGRGDDDDPPSQQVDLYGTGACGTTPMVALSAGNLDFRNQEQGTTSSGQTLVLVNAGGGALSIGSIAASGAFSQTNTCPIAPAALPSWNSCVISVSFQPPAYAKGAQAGAITITDNNNGVAGSTQVVSLTGRATP